MFRAAFQSAFAEKPQCRQANESCVLRLALSQWPQALQAESDYLNVLLHEVRDAIKRRQTMQQAVDTVGLSQRDRWLLFDAFNRRNVTVAFAELEWEDDD